MTKRTALPDVLTDAALNRFITGVLLDARRGGDELHTNMGDTLIERTVEQIRAFFPAEYSETPKLDKLMREPEQWAS